MKLFWTLLKDDLYSFKEAFKRANAVRLLVVSVFFLLLILIAFAIFLLTRAGFDFLIKEEEMVGSLSLFTLGLAFLLLSGIFLISNLLYFFNIIFKNQKIYLLTTLPVPAQILFTERLLVATFLSIWPIFVLGMPVLLAFGLAAKVNLWFYFVFISSLLPLLLFFSLLSALITIFVTRIAGKLTFKVTILALIILIPILSFAFAKFLIPKNLGNIFSQSSLTLRLAILDKSPSFLPFLPSAWYVRSIEGWLFGNVRQLLINLAALWLSVIVFFAILLSLVKSFYLLGIKKSLEGAFFAGAKEQKVKAIRSQTFETQPLGALLKKELLTFLRNGSQIAYIGFLLFLTLVYFFALSRVPAFENLSVSLLSTLITANLVFIGYILTVVAIRFAFPSISLEGKSAWIVWSLPVKLTTLFWAKVFFFIPANILIAAVLANLSAAILGFDFTIFISSLIFLVIIAVLVATIALTFGSIWPDFSQKSGESASTSMPGLAATILSLFCVSSFTFWFWSALKTYLTLGMFWPSLGVVLVVFTIVANLLIFGLWFWTNQSLKKIAL